MRSCEDVLRRDSYDTRSTERRRILAAAVCCLLGGTVWHLAGESVLRGLARSSVGCPWREELVAWAVFGREASAFEDEFEYDLRHPSWIAISSTREHDSSLHSASQRDRPIIIVDDELRIRGSIAGAKLAVPPDDADGDDNCEVVLSYDLRETEEHVNAYRWAVIRIGPQFNEVVWVGLVSGILQGRSWVVDAAWRGNHAASAHDLTFVSIEVFRTESGKMGFKPAKTVAVFRWDPHDGLLYPRSLPDDGSVVSWTPETGVPVGQDDDMYTVLRHLLPVPEGLER